MTEVWDRQENEPKTAYGRFLYFLNLGPGRQVDAAYSKSQEISKNIKIKITTWYTDSSRFNWKERAYKWDLEQARLQSRETANRLYSELSHALDQVIAAGKNLQPDNWKDYIEALLSIANYLPAPDFNMGAEQAEAGEASGNVTPFRGRQQSA